MVFSSLTFLFVFLPLCIITYFLIPSKYVMARKYALTAFSIAFYASGEPVYVFLIVTSVSVTYILSRQIEKRNTLIFIFSVMWILAPLGLFKYCNFMIDNINSLFHYRIPNIDLIMPIGISFYTFQILTYVVDLYRGQVKRQNNIGLLTLYIFFFPQLIAGPIVKYADIKNALETSNEDWEKIKVGVRRFLTGLAKKVIMANQIGLIVDKVMSLDFYRVSTPIMWLTSVAFTMQLYFDFSGYSDMAIGLGKIFGFDFKENFELPYHSKSVTEFWRRWHISMGSFFREYIYIPLGGSHRGKIRWMLNILIVWAVTGLWHGANWNFVIWGLYYAALLMIEKLFLGKVLQKVPSLISWGYTSFVTIIGWTLFMWDTNNIHYMILRIMRLFSQKDVVYPFSVSALELKVSMIYLIVGVVVSTPILGKSVELISNKTSIASNSFFEIFSDVCYIMIFVICIVFIIGETFNPFIYFRF